MLFDKTTKSTTQFYSQAHFDLGTIYRAFVARVKSHVLRPPSDRGDYFAWMLLSKETGPLYCSEAKDFAKSPACQRMIGDSLQKGWLDKPEGMLKPRMSPFDPGYIHYAIVRKDAESEPERVDLEKGLEASQEAFKAMLRKDGPDQKYQMGVMSHIGQKEFGFQFATNFPKTPLSTAESLGEIAEMLAVYCQGPEKSFGKEVTTEADAKLITLAAAQEKAKEQLEAVKASYKGEGATLHRQYSFAAYVYDREAGLVQYAGRWNVNNQKSAVEQAAWRLYSGFFKRFRDYAWLIINT